MASNRAAWVDGPNKPLQVRKANMPQLGPDELVVQNATVAINPVDWKMQDGFFLDQVEMPFILGTDVAGVVHEVGSAVKNFKRGDRVLAYVHPSPGPPLSHRRTLRSRRDTDPRPGIVPV